MQSCVAPCRATCRQIFSNQASRSRNRAATTGRATSRGPSRLSPIRNEWVGWSIPKRLLANSKEATPPLNQRAHRDSPDRRGWERAAKYLRDRRRDRRGKRIFGVTDRRRLFRPLAASLCDSVPGLVAPTTIIFGFDCEKHSWSDARFEDVDRRS